MFHEQNFKRVFPKQQNAKLFSSSTQPFNFGQQYLHSYAQLPLHIYITGVTLELLMQPDNVGSVIAEEISET